MASTPARGDSAAVASLHALPRADYRARENCRTLVNYRWTLFWTFTAVVACALGYLVEKFIFMRGLGWITETPYRMFKNPAELPMRLFGLPHFVVGTLFLFSSRRVRTPGSAWRLTALTALGAALCWLFYYFGGPLNPLALLLFYFYFLVHGFRDEAYFYRSNGDMPAGHEHTYDRLMALLQFTFLGIMAALIIPGYILYGQFYPKFRHPLLESMFPADWPYLLRFAATLIPMSLAAAAVLRHIARDFPGGLRGLWHAHWPILSMFLCSTAIILLPLATGPWPFNLVVLMHFVGWYLFGRQRLAAAEAARPAGAPVPRPGTWAWMRGTRTGFTWLHLGLAGVVVLLVAVNSWAFGTSGPLELVIGSKSFFYWTIMHVTLSFFPR